MYASRRHIYAEFKINDDNCCMMTIQRGKTSLRYHVSTVSKSGTESRPETPERSAVVRPWYRFPTRDHVRARRRHRRQSCLPVEGTIFRSEERNRKTGRSDVGVFESRPQGPAHNDVITCFCPVRPALGEGRQAFEDELPRESSCRAGSGDSNPRDESKRVRLLLALDCHCVIRLGSEPGYDFSTSRSSFTIPWWR